MTGCVTTTTGNDTLASIYKTPADTDKAIAYIEKQGGERDISTRLVYASLLISKQRFEDARIEYQAVIDNESGNIEALFGLAVVSHYQEKPEERNSWLDKVLAIDPKHVGANILKGQIYLDEDKYKQAEPFFMTVLKQNKDDVAALSGLANVYMRTERMDPALAFMDRAITLEPNNAYLYVDRSRALIVKRKYNQALKDLGKAIELEPNVEWHYIDRARLLLSHFEDPDAAYSDLKKAESLSPDNLFTCYYLGEILDDKADYVQASKYFQKILAMRPDFFYIYESVAKIAFMKGDYGTAQLYFLKAYDEYDQNVGYVFIAYYCMVKTGKQADGEKMLADVAKGQKAESATLEVFRYYLNKSGAAIVSDKVAREQDPVLRNRLLFHVAMKDDLSGRADLAMATMQIIAETKGSFEADLSRWYLTNR
jgi:tetratricopeptide (TPR) repeat protein